MNKIFITHSYFLRFDPKQFAIGLPYPPLATLYAAAILKENGYEVSFFDTMFADGPEVLSMEIQKHKPDFFVIYDDGFNYLTKMCLTNMREAAFRMIEIAKLAGCTIIVSSSDATDHYPKYLKKGADFILIGEAEITLLELIDAIRNELTVTSINGLAYLDNNDPVKTDKRNVIRDLNTLPFAAWEMINVEPYRKLWLKNAGYFSLNMVTTRGCPFHCNWCAKPIYGNRYSSRSPAHVVEELQILQTKFGFDHIWFCDDIFGLKPGWVKQFAEIVEQQKLKFKFKIQARVDLMLQENYIQDLARAGCENVWMGAESGSQKILEAMDKGTKVEQIYQSTQLLKKNGIKPSFFIQFGYPGETKEDIMMTIRMINELLPYELGISVSYPLPGTVFYDRVKSELHEKANWTDSDELMLMFKNTFQPAFYKQLHRFVHKNYRKHLAICNIKNIIEQPGKISLNKLRKAASVAWYLPAAYFAKQKLDTLEAANY